MTGKNHLTELLRPHVGALKAAADGGDGLARNVITLYEMHRACPSDPGAPALCEATFSDWLRARRELTDDAGKAD